MGRYVVKLQGNVPLMKANTPRPMTENEADPAKRVRVVVADAHPVIRIGVENLLQSETDVEIVGEAGTGEEMISRIQELRPELLLLELNLPGFLNSEARRAVIHESSSTQTILLTETLSNQTIIEGLQLGARGIVVKAAITHSLAPAIRAVSSRKYWVGDKAVPGLAQALQCINHEPVIAAKTIPALTPRELEVVNCIVRGCSNRDIAQQFQLSEETVKRHLSNIFEKTGVSTRLELALYAIEHHLVAFTAPTPANNSGVSKPPE